MWRYLFTDFLEYVSESLAEEGTGSDDVNGNSSNDNNNSHNGIGDRDGGGGRGGEVKYKEENNFEEEEVDEEEDEEEVEGNDVDERRSTYYSEDDEELLEGWSAIPDIILEDILSLLSPKHRHQCSMVSRRWYRYFYSSRVWETFTLNDRSFTRKKFNLYLGYQHESDPRKVQLCLARVGSFFKTIIIPPIKDYFNLYEFLRVLGYFLNFFDNYPMPHLKTFHFTFHCEFWEHSGVSIHGTGGDILDKMKKVIGSMKNMKEIHLANLMLDMKDATNFIDPIYTVSGDSLQILSLVNCTNDVFPFPMIAQMSALQKLVISSNNIDDESVLLFAGTQLTEIQIVEDHLTPSSVPISPVTWSFLLEMIPYIRVVLRTLGRLRRDMMQQPGAPVYSVIHENPRSQLRPAVAMQIADLYHKNLELFAQLKLPRVHGSRSFTERIDSNLLMMVKSCPKLHTLIIKERLSTASLLLLVHEAKNLKKLYVRKNALLRKYDWPRLPEWSDSFYRWLKRTSYDINSLEDYISGVLDYRWHPLTDKQFKLLSLR
ncbi:uncharacterized protein LOC115226514 [Octopus sinensis]|uniref:Uncharacterized protein LOC115226514 n=1 Tax=Octopus sinensis TaxID=2607531 RepID=A0A6P7TMV8_9MOLL|nr:uncharacterized protein LOC115226514 [Octopus sinensis]